MEKGGEVNSGKFKKNVISLPYGKKYHFFKPEVRVFLSLLKPLPSFQRDKRDRHC
jgi:hypothetical protein